MANPLASALSPFWALTNTVARAALRSRAQRLPCPVISVGNIVAGGVGKTELVAAIAARLQAQGKRVVVASRGYGSRWEKHGGVAHDAETAITLGFPDEAIVVLKKAPGVSVAVGADRAAVLLRNWEELQPGVVLLDDGLQHFRLARDLDIVVHDFNVRHPVLRDLPVLLNRVGVRVALSDIPPAWRARGPAWVRAGYRLTGAVDAHGKRGPLPSKALAFCGIGNPSRFRRALEAAGTRVAAFRTFSDHHAYGERDARSVAQWAARSGGESPVLTTLKDYVKLSPYVESQGGVTGFEPRWVELELELTENAAALWTAIDETLAKGGPK